MIAVFAGVVSGIIDSLFVNKPNFKGIANSALNSLTDKESEKILSFLADKHSDCDIKWKSIKEKVS